MQRQQPPRRPLALALFACATSPVFAQQHAVTELPTVIVNDQQDALGQYLSPRSSAVTRFEASSLEVAQSSQTLNRNLIEDSGAVELRDLLKLVPSAFAGHTRLAPFTSFSWKIRGFDAAVTRNGFRQIYFEDVDQSAFSNIERIEVIKGPGGAAYGKEGLGGTIHMVTRRPEKQFGGSAGLRLASEDGKAANFDLTGPIADSGLGLRLNGELERSGSFVDHQDVDRDNFATTLAFDRGGPVRAYVIGEYQSRESLQNPGLPVVGTVRGNGAGEVDRETYLGEPDSDYLHTWSPLLQAWLEIDFAPGWTFSPRYQHFRFNVNQQHLRLRAPDAADPTLISRNGRYNFHERDRTDTLQLELRGRFALGPTTHQSAFGYENNRARWNGDWFNYASVPAIDALNPRYDDDALVVDPTRVTFSGRIVTHEYFLQDLVSLTERLRLLAGARHTEYDIKSEFAGAVTDGQDSRHTDWQLGATYLLSPAWSVFAGGSSTSSVDNIVGATAADGSSFEPERARQYEIGLKHESAALSGSLALFQINFSNATTADPDDPDFSVQTGKQRARGVELELGWQPLPRWNLIGGLAWIDAEVRDSNDGDEGNRLANVARVQATLWNRYRIDPSWDVSGGLYHVGKRYGTQANTYELDAYTTVDLGAGWQIDPRLRAELFLRNLFDETYYTGNSSTSVYPGEPRSVELRLSARF